MGKTYSIPPQSVDKLNEQFTKGYDYRQWFFKLKTNELVFENLEKFIEKFGDKELKEEPIKSYKLSLKAELVFTFYHSTEALFSLIICGTTSSVPWVSMQDIKVKGICDYIRGFVLKDKLTDEQIRFMFFNSVSTKDIKRKEFVESIKFIREYLKRIGRLFLENEVYNEYKHGLRVMTTNAWLRIMPEKKNSKKPLLSRGGDSQVFLKLIEFHKEGKECFYRIEECTVSFDYKLYRRLSYMNYNLIKNIFSLRAQATKSKPGEQLTVDTFEKINVDELFKQKASNSFKFVISHPYYKLNKEKDKNRDA